MRVQKIVLNRVEGDVNLKLCWDQNGKISDAYVVAYNYRGFERILQGKDLLDALVINPRICGICGHAHLMATVNAIENLYKNSSIDIEITEKAKLIKQITLCSEIVQNHLKWFYLFVIPDFLNFFPSLETEKFKPFVGEKWKKAVKFSSEIVKVIAIFGGQWPHTSYAIPGGITSEPLKTDIVDALSIVDRLIKYVEEEIFGMSYEDYLNVKDLEEFLSKSKGGDLTTFIDFCVKTGLDKEGQSYEHFITVSTVYPCINEGVIKKKKCKLNLKKIKEVKDFNILYNKETGYTYANGVRYDGLPMQTGPLARRLTSETELFLNLYRLYKDSYLVRVWARVDEILRILINMKDWLLKINVNEKSYIKPKDYKKLYGEAFGYVEASRGSLIHKVKVEKGVIKSYNIITPTMWNLGSRCNKFKSPAEKAVLGLEDPLKAQMVLRSFDVCSVCLTH